MFIASYVTYFAFLVCFIFVVYYYICVYIYIMCVYIFILCMMFSSRTLILRFFCFISMTIFCFLWLVSLHFYCATEPSLSSFLCENSVVKKICDILRTCPCLLLCIQPFPYVIHAHYNLLYIVEIELFFWNFD